MRILLSHWLMRRVGRDAFPDDLERLRPLRDKLTKSIGKTSPGGLLAGALIGVWSSTTRVSAYDLMVAHRQVDLDTYPPADFAAKDTIAALATAVGIATRPDRLRRHPTAVGALTGDEPPRRMPDLRGPDLREANRARTLARPGTIGVRSRRQITASGC